MKIPLFKIHWEEEDIEAVAKVIRSGKYWCTGAEIEQFEKAIAEYLGVAYCTVFNSGGSALFGLMNTHGFGLGDEIIVPSFTFIATAYAPLYVGAKPVFADIEEKSFGLDPEDVKKRITSKTRAILPIHYGGMPCRVPELKEIAEDAGIVLIEDIAEAFGAKFGSKFVGTFGDSGLLSFCQNKIFTTSEGGCATTDNREHYRKLQKFRSYGRVFKGDYFGQLSSLDYVDVGHNMRMSTLLAALGLSQLRRVDDIIKERRRIAQFMSKQLSQIPEITVPSEPDDDSYSVYQMYTIRVLEGAEKRDDLMNYLVDRGITSKVYFDPAHLYSVFKKLNYQNLTLQVTSLVSSQVLSLPIYPGISNEEMNYVIECVSNFFQ